MKKSPDVGFIKGVWRWLTCYGRLPETFSIYLDTLKIQTATNRLKRTLSNYDKEWSDYLKWKKKLHEVINEGKKFE